MKLVPPPKQDRLTPLVIRETPDISHAFAMHAARSGVSTCEALRQVILHYNAKPWRFHGPVRSGAKTAHWALYANPRTRRDALAPFQMHASRHGVTWQEALRQCVRKHLAEQGGVS